MRAIDIFRLLDGTEMRPWGLIIKKSEMSIALTSPIVTIVNLCHHYYVAIHKNHVIVTSTI